MLNDTACVNALKGHSWLKCVYVYVVPSHNTAAHSREWPRWAGQAGTRREWCCQWCDWPDAW